MKSILVFTILLFIPLVAFAQNSNEVSQEGMQNYIMQMQACMADVNETELDAIGQRSDEVDAAIAALCEQGNRDEAQNMAIAYSKELAGKPVIIQMKKCSEIAAKVMPAGEKPFAEEIDFTTRHVCDEINER